MKTFELRERKLDYGTSVNVYREIRYNNDNDKTSLCLETDKDGMMCRFLFNGNQVSSTSPQTIEELRRFKALLNSFEEL